MTGWWGRVRARVTSARETGQRPDVVGALPSPGVNPAPVVHKPHWRWLIAGYFFTGGVAAGSLVIASIARLTNGDDRIVRAGRYAAIAALLPSPLLLTLDLGRPERFWRMLTHWNPRSPMSWGSWDLVLFSGVCGFSALHEAACDGLFGTVPADGRGGKFPDKALAVLSLPPALFFAGYTGILLGATAVPLWARWSRFLGPLFLSSAVATGGAATAIAARLLGDGPAPALAHAERLASMAELAVLVAACARDRRARDLLVARPSHRTALAASLAGTMLGVSGRAGPAGPIVTLAGGFLLRAIILFAGNASADDPEATYAMTR